MLASTPAWPARIIKARSQLLQSSLLNVEVALKSVLRYMPFGVMTYPQLRQELRRCRELGKPWPFVLAVIPTPSKKRESAVYVRPIVIEAAA